ncbi:capsular polysaccharide biosynthesis protein [Anaerotaenia torta]|uniref:Wzz/FepE/Etk N-terminal domain-containing protein n=1 Tax=Anaerotaenia torta TaxID=433293 RepID=UPI003D25CDCB
MNSNQHQDDHMENEIVFKDLLMVCWKRKYSIISITMVFTVLAGIISVFFISPVYDTSANIIINMPENYHTRYGDYILPLSANDQYLQLLKSNEVLLNTIEDMQFSQEVTVNELSKRISIKAADKDSTSFTFVVSADTPEESLYLANALYDNYIKFIDAMLKERTVNYFYNNFSVELITLETTLTKEQLLLQENQKLLSQIKREYKTANLDVIDYLGKDGNYILPEDTINPNYIRVESDIISNQQKINDLISSINIMKQYLSQLEEEKESIVNYYKNGKTENITVNLVSIVDSNIYMPSELVAPTQKTSPSNARNVVIGVVLGGMMGVFVVLFRAYWKNEL